MIRRSPLHFVMLALLLAPWTGFAQAYQGYTLYSAQDSRNTYLVDMNNTVVHSWSHSKSGGYSCYLLSDGSLMRPALSTNSSLNAGGQAGVVQRVAWNGTLLWEYIYSSNTYRTHHDIEPMPNGNVLLIAWEVKNSTQCTAAGLNHSASLWPDHIIEVQPVGSTGGNIVWQWHFWDHLIQDYSSAKSNYGVVANHPELIDINVGSTSGDWTHINSVSYNPELDQIVISSHFLDELYVIDHSTTTAEAASHSGGNQGKGGDILYRWGCPSNYRASGSQVFNVVHSACWIPAGLPGGGNIMAFNNREGQGTSIIMEIVPPVSGTGAYTYTPNTAYGPSSATWTYTAAGFYSNHLGGIQRLPNGNTMIAQSTSGKLFEVTSGGSTVWSYTPGGQIPRVLRYAASYPGLSQLPVTFVSFRGSVGTDQVELYWDVASENSNHGFQVERQIPPSTEWEQLGFVAGRGTTTVARQYSYMDPVTAVMQGATTVKYRLRQLDTDGSAHLSSVVEVAMNEPPAAMQFQQVYPNPVYPGAAFSSMTNIGYYLQKDMQVRVSVHDALGREVALLHDGFEQAGYHAAEWDAGRATPGIYFVRLAGAGAVRTARLIVCR